VGVERSGDFLLALPSFRARNKFFISSGNYKNLVTKLVLNILLSACFVCKS
jgi:hypothetical protein